MARSQFADTAIDQYGSAVISTRVTVYNAGTTTLSTVYENEVGSTLKGNPFNATTGYISFWMEPGSYDVVVSDQGIPPSYSTKTIRFDSIPAIEGVSSSTIIDEAIINDDISTSAAIDYSKLDPVLVVSSLPSSPYNGQEIYYLADDSNGIVWHLKYRSTSASSYKWEFLGGDPLYDYVASAGSGLISTSYTTYSPSGPVVTSPLAGDYIVDMAATLHAGGAGRTMTMSYSIGGTAANDNWRLILQDSNYTSLMARHKQTGISAGATFFGQYKTGTAATGFAQARSLSLRPIRVG